jgi:uncharacterized protein (DUF305 family)
MMFKIKTLLYGSLGFLFAGMIVFGVGCGNTAQQQHEVTMSEMTSSLRDKKGDEFDALFITHMIEHHQAAVDMARLSEQNAKHEEIKKLSREIIAAQEKEIQQMRDWQKQWGYSADHKGGH